jgi:hypothetical protein
MNRTFIGAVAISGLMFTIGGLALAHARQQQPVTPPVSAKRASTIGLMRSLNTAEYVYRRNFGHFASLDDLVYDANYIHHSNPRVQDVADDGTDIVPDLKAVVVLSPREDSYALAVYDKAKDDEGFATFSDEKGVIYEGQPLQTADANAAHTADINLVRTINTAEITYQWKYGRFADFDTLNAAGLIQRYGNAEVTFAKSPAVVPNLQVVVLVPAVPDAWLVALHDTSAPDDPYSAFSDPTGIIYRAEPLH